MKGEKYLMKKVGEAVARETKYIAAWVVILSIIMQAVFLLSGHWDYAVILGNLLSGAFAVLNFFLMGITVQKAVEKDEKGARAQMRASQSMRTFMLFAVAAVGVLVPCFNTWASIIPLFFPRIAIAARPLFKNQEVDAK